MKMKSNMLTSMSLMMSLMMTISESPMTMWMMMEISNILFTMMFVLMQTNFNTPGIMVLIQFFSAAMILMSIIENSKNPATMGIILKLGMFPSHNWMPMVIYMTPWKLNIMTMIITKIGPFMIMEIMTNMTLMMMSAMITPLISSLKLIKVNNTKMIMAYSSIIHSSWMTFSQSISMKFWSIYFVTYSINTFMICMMMSMNSFQNSLQTNIIIKMMWVMLMFSMMSTPPLTPFLSKMLVMSSMTPISALTMMSLIGSSSISILYYTRMIMKNTFMHSKSTKLFIPNKMIKINKIKMTIFFLLMIVVI